MRVDTPVPMGPRKIAAKQQVSVPAELLAVIGLAVGDEVWISLNPDRPGTLVVMPRSVMEDVFRKGWTALS